MVKGTVKVPTVVATLTTLTDEVSDGLYCNRMGITAGQCRQVWLGFCDFVFNVLKKNKVSGAAARTNARGLARRPREILDSRFACVVRMSHL